MRGNVGGQKHEVCAGLITRGVLAANASMSTRQVILRAQLRRTFLGFSLFVFIVISLAVSRFPGAYNADVFAAIGVGHNQNPAFLETPKVTNRCSEME